MKQIFEADTEPEYIQTPRLWQPVYGGRISGEGGLLDQSLHKPNIGTRWIKAYPGDEPLLTYKGFGGIIEALTFSGDARLKTTPREERAALGLVIDKDPDSGMGCGKLALHDVGFTNFKVAIQMGLLEEGQNTTTEHNADQLYSTRLHSYSCDTMLRAVHAQAVDTRIDYCRPYATDLAFDMHGGGNLHVGTLLCMYGSKQILRLGPDIGSNNASYIFDRVICDNNNDVPIFVVMENRCAACEIVFSNVRIGNSAVRPGAPIFNLRGGASLTLDGFKSLAPGDIFFDETRDDYAVSVNLQRASFSGDDLSQLVRPSSRGLITFFVGAVENTKRIRRFKPGVYSYRCDGSSVTPVEEDAVDIQSLASAAKLFLRLAATPIEGVV